MARAPANFPRRKIVTFARIPGPHLLRAYPRRSWRAEISGVRGLQAYARRSDCEAVAEPREAPLDPSPAPGDEPHSSHERAHHPELER